MSRAVLLAVSVLLVATFLPVNPARAADPDPAFLVGVEHLLQTARKAGPLLWPGWDPLATPLAFYRGDSMTVLIGHPAPPAGFRRLATSAVSAPVFVSDSTSGFMHANTAQMFAGTLTSFLSYDDFMKAPGSEAIALAVHELFHAQEQRMAPNKAGDIRVLLWGQYPEFSARNRALLQVEATLLLNSTKSADEAEVRRLAAKFLTTRAERRKDLNPELVKYEDGEEASEGLAQYIEVRMLQLLPEVDKEAGSRDVAVSLRIHRLEPLDELPHDRDKFYALGMGEALLLDRVRPKWKDEYASSPAMLDELLARSVQPLPPAEAAAFFAEPAFGTGLAREEKYVEQRSQEGSQRLQRLFDRGGERVVFELGPLKNHMVLRGFNPNGSVALSPSQIAHVFLMLDLGGAPLTTLRLEFRGLPAVYDSAEDTLWTLLPTSVINSAVETYKKAPPADAGKVTISTNGFLAQMAGVQLERRARELRIRPATDLKQTPLYKPPEFVRPDIR